MKRPVQYISPQTDSVLNALLTDFRWSAAAGETLTLHYSFYEADSDIYTDPRSGYDAGDADYDYPFRPGFAGFSAAQRVLTRAIFADIETIIDVDFVEVEDSLNSELRLGLTDLGREQAAALAFAPGPRFVPFNTNPAIERQAAGLSGDIWLASTLHESFFASVLVHETGHALGLSHPFENGFEDIAGLRHLTLVEALDYYRYTAMSYDSFPAGVSGYEVEFFPVAATFMPLDIWALQLLYGMSRSGADDLYIIRGPDDAVDWAAPGYAGYQVHDYVNGYVAVADGGGGNTLLIALDGDLHIDLRPGSWSDTGGGYRTDALADDNLYLAPETLLDELLLTGAGDHRVTVGDRDVSAYRFFESGSRLTVMAADGARAITIEGGDELVFADATLPATGLMEAIARLNARLILAPDGPLYLSPIDGPVAVSALDAWLYRAYYGGLGRAPDRGGFAFWREQLAAEVYDFNEVSGYFVDSPEFRGLADRDGDGLTSDAEFFDHLYVNVFGREPDAAGYARWLDRLAEGHVTQPEAFSSMTQSDEFVLLSAGTVSDMLFV